jgi:predicted esterase YcpF (UPF0227 family)
MKKDKKLISEIERLNELMGNKSLLNEQVNLIDDILLALTKVGTKQTDELAVAASKFSDETLSSTQRAKALEDVIRIARKNGDDDLIKQINKSLMRSDLLSQGIDKLVKDSNDLIEAGLARNASKKDLLSMLVDDFNPSTGDEVLDAFIKRQLRKKLGTQIDNVIKGVDDVVDDVADDTGRVTDDSVDDAGKVSDDVTDDAVDVVDDNLGGTPESTIPNIQKSMDEVVDEVTDEEIELINKKLGTIWSNTIERLKTVINPYLKKVTTLQDEIIKDIALWQRATPNAKPILRKRIIAKLEVLEVRSADLLEATDSWIDTEIRPLAAKDPSVRNFYNKVTKREGWSRIKILSNLWKGAKIGIRDVFSNNKALRGAYLKVAAKPFTIPASLIRRIFKDEFKWIGKLSPEQSKAFKNWFVTTNPAGWKAVQKVFTEQGFFAGSSYIFAQALYRYMWVSTMVGIGRTLGALTSEGVDLVFGTNVSDSPITNYLFGIEKFDELRQNLVDNKGGDVTEYGEIIIDMISEQSEPFRNWVGMWPAAKVAEATGTLIMAVMDDTLDEKLETLEQEAQEAADDVQDIAEEEGITLPGQDNQQDNSPSGEPGSLEHFIEDTGGVGATIDDNGVITFGGYRFKWDNNKEEYVDVE